MLAVVIVLEVVPLDVSDKVNAGRNNASSSSLSLICCGSSSTSMHSLSMFRRTYILPWPHNAFRCLYSHLRDSLTTGVVTLFRSRFTKSK